MDKSVIRKLQDILCPEGLFLTPEERSCYSYDGTGRTFLPDAVAFPRSAQEIASIMQLANAFNFPVVPRGAGSGMTGGSLPVKGGLVLVTSRMNRIVEIDPVNMIAIVEPGVITGDLQEELQKDNLMYPPDPASLKFCTIGGNAAECAGGPSAVKYGVTKDYIIGLEVVLPTGEIMQSGGRTEKGVVGYDLTRLFIGSEGTLGIFTKLTLRLLSLPDSKATFLLTFSSLAKATETVARILSSGITPCTLEYMDRTAIRVVRDHITLAVSDETEALIILEIDGSKDEVVKQEKQLTLFLEQEKIAYSSAADETERKTIWTARRSISPATFSLKPNKIGEDIVVPRSRIPDLVAYTENLARELDLIILTFGHAGDGNIHVNIMVDNTIDRERTNGQTAKQRLFTYVVELGGTLSGEHGIGITKSEYLPLEIDETALTVMQNIKKLFDPNDILNPGKIFPAQS